MFRSHTEMRDIVTVWKGGCDKDILFSVLRQSGKTCSSNRRTRPNAGKLTPIGQDLVRIEASPRRPGFSEAWRGKR